MARILVVDDDAGMRRSLAIILRREGYEVAEAADGRQATDHLGSEVFDLVFADLRMEPMSGIDLLRQVKQMSPEVEVILLTAYGTIETAVEAMKLGACDFVTKPFQVEEILMRTRNALEKRSLRAEVHRLRSEVASAAGFDGIVGVSEGLGRVLNQVKMIAQTDSTVLITGESGSGKELVARAIHGASRRARGPFVSVNCSEFARDLLEDTLFGHVKGSFSGAVAARKGLFEEAQGGTFFLDEIGEVALDTQPALLRVLQDRTIRRQGDNHLMPIDVRIIAATNRELETRVKEGRFREDLFHRLNVIRVDVPPLRRRREDIPLLTRHFLDLHCRRSGRPLEGIAPAAMEILTAYEFPGNVRELSNVIEQAVALTTGPVIGVQDLPGRLHQQACAPAAPSASPVPEVPLREIVEGAEREQIVEALRRTKGNVSRTARLLGINRNTVRHRLEKYGLVPHVFRA